jgi:hypothetical protein
MARHEYTSVSAGASTPPPDPGGGFYAAPNGGQPPAPAGFVPWRFFKFTGRAGTHPVRPDDEGFDLPSMSDEQLEAYHYIRDFMAGRHRCEADVPEDAGPEHPDRFRGRVLILTGAAGSGKSVLVRWLTRTCSCSVCATTGSAALLVGGITIDRMFSFSRATWRGDPAILDRRMKESASTIVIDEASMIGYNMASCVAAALDLYRGKRVVLVGDWAQAAPVKEGWPFMSPLFLGAEVVNLKRCYRQTDPEYLDALNELRRGTLTPYFDRCVAPAPDLDDETLCMYATNKAVAARNASMYRRCVERTGEKSVMMRAYVATGSVAPPEKGDPPPREGDPPRINWRLGGVPDWKEKELLLNSKLANDIELCRGARVIITWNDKHREKRYVNGDVGVITGMPRFFPKYTGKNLAGLPEIEVKLDRTGETVDIGMIGVDVYDPIAGAVPNPNIRIVGYPLLHGWAVTIHKSQGMTLPGAFVHMRSIHWMPARHGMAYVALSRVRDASTLRIDEVAYGTAECDAAVEGLV